jgi:phosphate transport system permease protein
MKSIKNKDWFYYICLTVVFLFSMSFLGIFITLFFKSLPTIHRFGLNFIFTRGWNPVTSEFGALGCIIGTLTSSLLALIIAIPTSFGIVVFIKKLAPFKLQKSLRMMIDLLAGIPSIIFGMWGLFALAPIIGNSIQPWLSKHFTWFPLFDGAPFGIGLFTAGIVLSIMIIPYIASVIYDVFEMVPNILQESAYALGSTTWETLIHIIIPYGRTGIIGGIMLGLGRALGETMAVSFVIGNAHTLTTTLFSPSNSITSTLANEFNEAHGDIYTSSLMEIGLFLFLITTGVVFLSQLLIRFSFKQRKQRAFKHAYSRV